MTTIAGDTTVQWGPPGTVLGLRHGREKSEG
jgi:hypothetical protein